MTYDTIASTKLSDVLKTQVPGEPVNVHVVSAPREPKPDFDAMQKAISGSAGKANREKDGHAGGEKGAVPTNN